MQMFFAARHSVLHSTHSKLQQICVFLEQSASIAGGLGSLHFVPR